MFISGLCLLCAKSAKSQRIFNMEVYVCPLKLPMMYLLPARMQVLNFIIASILLHERYNTALAAGPLNAVERSAADFPAFRPKTAPEVRPLPPG